MFQLNVEIDSMIYRGASSDTTSNSTQVSYPQVDIHTLEENYVSKVRSEVNNVMTTVETRVQEAVLTVIENLVITRVELTMKVVNASPGWSVDDNVFELIKWIFRVRSKAYT